MSVVWYSGVYLTTDISAGWSRLPDLRRRADGELVRCGVQVHEDLVPFGDLAGQQGARQLVADRGLDQPTQRPGPEHRVEPGQREPFPGGRAHREDEPPRGQPRRKPLYLQVDDPGQLRRGQRVEDDHVVEPVEELRLERRADRE